MRDFVYKKAESLVGSKCNKLTAIEVCKDSGGSGMPVMLKCQCDCGKIIKIRKTIFENRHQISCGCEGLIKTKIRSTKHGCYGTRLYRIWNGMLARTKRKSTKEEKRYWGRGISVCDEWGNDFDSFRKWAEENGYSDDLTLDRIDNNGNYTPTNCRWISSKEQQKNTSRSVWYKYKDEKHILADWAKILGVCPTTLQKRIKKYGVCDKSFYAGKYNTNGELL